MSQNTIQLFVCVTILFFEVVSPQDWGLLQFPKGIKELKMCIKTHKSLYHNKYLKIITKDEISIIAQDITLNFYMSTKPKEDLDKVSEIINGHRRRFHDKMSYQPLWDELYMEFENALLDCSLNNKYGSTIEKKTKFDTTAILQLPIFTSDLLNVDNILDYLLVNWEGQDLLGTKESRVNLRRFAALAYDSLKTIFDNDGKRYYLPDRLKSFWKTRSQLFFDGRSTVPYINHLFTPDYHLPYTSGDISIFMDRRKEKFDHAHRDKLASNSQKQKILHMFPKDPSVQGKMDFYSDYERRSMTSSEYFYESRRIQFFRILVFFLELGGRGLLDDQDDEDYQVPENLKAILVDDNFYSKHLLKRRDDVLNAAGDDSAACIFHFTAVRELKQFSRVREAPLIELLIKTDVVRTIPPDDVIITTKKRTPSPTRSPSVISLASQSLEEASKKSADTGKKTLKEVFSALRRIIRNKKKPKDGDCEDDHGRPVTSKKSQQWSR